MKAAQWLAALVLALMIGGIAFVSVYLDNGSRGKAPADTPTQLVDLTFATKRYPDEGGKALTTEVHEVGSHDFWFFNDNEQDLSVGLSKKGCTCSEVNLSIAPDDWKPRFLAEAAGRLLQRAPRRLDGLPTLAATFDPARIFPDVPAQQTTTLTLENAAVVPAGAIGWVRLSWKRKDVGPVLLFANLWLGQRNAGVNARLDVGAMIAPPMEVNKDISTGVFDIRELDEGKKAWIVCWSVTRPAFRVKAELIHERGKAADSDPIELGAPVALTSADFRRMEQSEKTHMLTIKSGYRIPLTLRRKAKDGTPMDWGHFRRVVRLTSEDEGIEPVDVRVTGEIHGEVRVGAKEGGAINLGPFKSSRGARGAIVLQTDVQNLNLNLDSSRLPAYLKVRFPKEPEKTATGHRMWLLEVEVPPNAASGDFPRADDPAYHDSAIYVKTSEKPPRSIRVPVIGTANAG